MFAGKGGFGEMLQVIDLTVPLMKSSLLSAVTVTLGVGTM